MIKITTSKGQQIEITAAHNNYSITIDGVQSITASCINQIKPVTANGKTYIASLDRIALTAEHVAVLDAQRKAATIAHEQTAPAREMAAYYQSREQLAGVLRG